MVVVLNVLHYCSNSQPDFKELSFENIAESCSPGIVSCLKSLAPLKSDGSSGFTVKPGCSL